MDSQNSTTSTHAYTTPIRHVLLSRTDDNRWDCRIPTRDGNAHWLGAYPFHSPAAAVASAQSIADNMGLPLIVECNPGPDQRWQSPADRAACIALLMETGRYARAEAEAETAFGPHNLSKSARADLFAIEDAPLVDHDTAVQRLAASAVTHGLCPKRVAKAVELVQDKNGALDRARQVYNTDQQRCDCPDATYRGHRCKHQIASIIHDRIREASWK